MAMVMAGTSRARRARPGAAVLQRAPGRQFESPCIPSHLTPTHARQTGFQQTGFASATLAHAASHPRHRRPRRRGLHPRPRGLHPRPRRRRPRCLRPHDPRRAAWTSAESQRVSRVGVSVAE